MEESQTLQVLLSLSFHVSFFSIIIFVPSRTRKNMIQNRQTIPVATPNTYEKIKYQTIVVSISIIFFEK